MCEPHRYVFGYGSLVDLDNLATFLGRTHLDPATYRYCALAGFRRTWNVAMHNLTDIPGYKCYLDPHTNNRPDIHVTFVNIREDRQSTINGIAFAVNETEFARIRARERNYDPIEVTGRLDFDPPSPAIAFIAKQEAIKRYHTGLAKGTSVVCADYHQTVESAFQSLGGDAWAFYQQSTDRVAVPLRHLHTKALDTEF